VPFIDLNEIVAERYEKEGAEKVGTAYFTTKDHTHTSPAGARLNAESVIEGIKHLKNSSLKKYVLKQ
jgi:lysophospholipase L1-like esterase